MATFSVGLILLHWSTKKVVKLNYEEVYKQLKNGTKPTFEDEVYHCERTEWIQMLREGRNPLLTTPADLYQSQLFSLDT